MNATLPQEAATEHGLMDAHALAALMREGGKCELVDVRTPGEFRAAHIVGARNVPLDQLDANGSAALFGAVHGAPLVLVCASGARARRAALRLAHAPGVRVLDGGIQAWQAAGLPVGGAGGAWAMERQVRAAAGAFVLAGCALGFAVNPWFYALAAFVGGGLVFSAVTNTCGMARVLGWMPWNR